MPDIFFVDKLASHMAFSLVRELNLFFFTFFKSRVHDLCQTNRITKYNTDLFQCLPFRLKSSQLSILATSVGILLTSGR
jgi:hypothetical protein